MVGGSLWLGNFQQALNRSHRKFSTLHPLCNFNPCHAIILSIFIHFVTLHPCHTTFHNEKKLKNIVAQYGWKLDILRPLTCFWKGNTVTKKSVYIIQSAIIIKPSERNATTSVSFTGEFSPNSYLKIMISTYRKDFPWENWPKLARFRKKNLPIAIFLLLVPGCSQKC
jgi:hypothetical protein